MRNGPRINLITIQRKTKTGTDSLKQAVYEWTEAFTGFAAVDVRPGREIFDEKAKQRFTQETYVFTCAFSDVDGVTTDMRISWEGRLFNIVSVAPDFAKKTDTTIIATLQPN